jgi:hypothetical protein
MEVRGAFDVCVSPNYARIVSGYTSLAFQKRQETLCLWSLPPLLEEERVLLFKVQEDASEQTLLNERK